MNHIALARKWRPKKFADLIGQETTITVLHNIISNNKLHHAYLLTGTRGVGKTTIARIIAKAINCLNLQGSEPCGICSNCIDIDRGSFVDVIEIDAASNTGVDNIRELIDNAQYAPTSGKYKIYIIDEVHMLSKSAFNAMLKTLEEPPAHVVFILATTDPQKVPITILSRCLQLKLRNLSVSQIGQHLTFILEQEKVQFEKSALEIIAEMAKGSVRDSLSILDQAIAFTNSNITLLATCEMLGISDDTFIYKILDALSLSESESLVKIATEIYNQGQDLENVLLNLNKQLCNIAIAQLTGVLEDQNLKPYISKFSVNDVQLYFEISSLGLNQINNNNKLQTFIMTLLRMSAFTLGSSNEKQIILKQNNFKVTHSELNIEQKINKEELDPPITKPTEAIKVLPTESKTTNEAPSSLNFDEEPLAEPFKKNFAKFENAVKFGGDWVGLIEAMVYKLDKLIQPFLVNAKLDNHNDDTFAITIDEKYQTAFSPPLITSINMAFNEYFKRPITINIKFAAQIDQTLKEKQQIKQSSKQQSAINAIENDANIIQMQELFSAKIVPSSIIPL